MDLVTISVSLGGAVLSSGLVSVGLNYLVFRHQARRENWDDYFKWSDGQIARAQELTDEQQANKVRRELSEAYQAARDGTTLDAWRSQQGVESIAPRSVGPEQPSTLTDAELEQLRDLLSRSSGIIPSLVSAEGHLLRGNAYYESGDFQQAVDSYTVALRLHPEDPEAYVNRGVAYRNLGEHQKALADYTEALRLRPDLPEAYNNRGAAYYHLGKHQKAIADYNEAMRLRPDDSELYANRGLAYRRMGEHQKAIEDFNEAQRLRPDCQVAYYNRACMYSLQQNIEPCIADLERAVALDAKHKEQGRSDPDLAWARQDARVRKLLDIP